MYVVYYKLQINVDEKSLKSEVEPSILKPKKSKGNFKKSRYFVTIRKWFGLMNIFKMAKKVKK